MATAAIEVTSTHVTIFTATDSAATANNIKARYRREHFRGAQGDNVSEFVQLRFASGAESVQFSTDITINSSAITSTDVFSFVEEIATAIEL